MPIQFRMNVNYVPDEALARENCGVLRRPLDLFKQAGVKTSYWFTGLAAEQVQRVDPEFLRLLGEAGMPVGHHGANRPPNPQPIHRVKGQNWDDDVRAILDYESHAIDPRTGELDKTTIGGLKRMQVKAAEAVAASQTAPPEYIDLGGDYLSLADAFQAFAHALARFAESGKLPDSVQAVDLLGPTEYRASGLPPVMAAVTLPTVTGEEIVGAAKRVSPALRDRIPAEVAVGRHKLNPAEFLLAMGQTILAIAKTGQPKPVSLHAVDLLPASVRENRLADRLTKLQFWTFKPERSKHSTTAKAVQ
jgi:hypothetical protein